MNLTRVGLLIIVFLMVYRPGWAQDQGNRYALIIAGLGGDAEHTETFKGYLFNTQKAFVESFGFEEDHITILGEQKIQDAAFVDDLSNAENIRASFASLSTKATKNDDVYVILFGHGGYEGGESRLNIPRRDLSQFDYAELANQIDARRLVFINTASASAPFIDVLGKEGRVVITATRSGTQKNETSFPRFMIEAFTDPGADQDKDGRVSVAEVFVFASERTAQWYEDNGNVPTEDALIADNGSAEGARLKDLETSGQGQLASLTYISISETELLAAGGQGSPELSAWLQEKDQIEREVARLKSRKAEMNVDDYYAELEVLFVRLAKGNEEIEAIQ